MRTTQNATRQRSFPLFDRPDGAFVDHVQTHGFAVLADALTPAEVDQVNAEALRLCRTELSSLDRGHGEMCDGDLTEAEALCRYLCIHNPDKLSKITREVISHPRIVTALTEVIGPDVKAMQSMLFIKSEGKPGQAWHQDEYFIPTRDRSLHAAWIALDDTYIDNGCLWVLPGSHKPGLIYPTRDQDNMAEYGCTIQAYDFPYDNSDAVPVEISAGSALIFNGYLLHRSLRNSGQRGYRRTLVAHYMSCASLLPWQLRGNDRGGTADFRDIMVVAGHDPYAYKGIEDRRVVYIRPDGASGCDS